MTVTTVINCHCDRELRLTVIHTIIHRYIVIIAPKTVNNCRFIMVTVVIFNHVLYNSRVKESRAGLF